MAYLIGDNYESKFINTYIEFIESDEALQQFFATTPRYPGTILKANWKSGNFIPPEVVPTRARITKGKAIYDWRTMRGGGTLVSTRFKDAVEALEPGQHQFLPLVVEGKDGKPLAEKYFFFNVVGRIEAIIDEKSNLKASGRGFIEGWGYEPRAGGWECALDQAAIGDRASWVEHRYGGSWFVSDRLAELLQQQKLSGFKLNQHCDEISR